MEHKRLSTSARFDGFDVSILERSAEDVGVAAMLLLDEGHAPSGGSETGEVAAALTGPRTGELAVEECREAFDVRMRRPVFGTKT